MQATGVCLGHPPAAFISDMEGRQEGGMEKDFDWQDKGDSTKIGPLGARLAWWKNIFLAVGLESWSTIKARIKRSRVWKCL